VDFEITPEMARVRDEVREFLAEYLTPELTEKIRQTGTRQDSSFERALAERSWIAPGLGVELGGLGWDDLCMMMFNEEMEWAGAPLYGPQTTLLVATAILHHGTEEQLRAIVRPAVKGGSVFVLGLSEPECGSDVAAVQTRAVRDGDEWIINGSKMFTTNAHVGDYVFLLTRTDFSLPKHRGLTTFIVPLSSEGIEIRPVITVSGERTNITFYNDVRVSDFFRVGDVNGGWATLSTGLAAERSGAFGGESVRVLKQVENWLDLRLASGAVDPDSQSRLLAEIGRAATENEVTRLLSWRSAWTFHKGRIPGVEGSMTKLFSSEALTRQAGALLDVFGPIGVRIAEDPDAPANGEVEWALRHALGATTYGGTSEIQRSIIAEHGLGLPRSR
jgi:alkylation response protein AidB-like acyl-CoA dehydrogenase